jgi:hypothetical protein
MLHRAIDTFLFHYKNSDASCDIQWIRLLTLRPCLPLPRDLHLLMGSFKLRGSVHGMEGEGHLVGEHAQPRQGHRGIPEALVVVMRHDDALYKLT